MTESIPIGLLGRIVTGREKGRVVEVVDDTEATGGYLILTYSDFDRSPEVFDVWVENLDDLAGAFEENGWQVEWQEGSEESAHG
jgi:hypothetical protein